MNLRGAWGQLLLLLIVIAGGVALFLMMYEKKAVDEWNPPSARVLREPYLAAERWLRAMEMPSRHLGSFEQAADLPPHSALIVPAGRVGMTAQARAAVLQFVRQGGHLLVESERWEKPDPLLEDLGISRSEAPDFDYHDDRTGFGSLRAFRNPTESASADDPALLSVRWEDQPAPLLVTTLGGELLSSEDAIRTINGDEGTRILQKQLGEGLITAINDISFAQNWRIGRNDNAQFFWLLLNDTPDLAHVYWYRVRPPQLWPWLKQHATPVLISLALLIVLFIWHGLPRFGPSQEDPSGERRRLSDHLGASGRFLWSAGQRSNLARAAAACAYDAAARRYPHLRSMAADDQIAFLCRRFQLPPSHAQQLVHGSDVREPTEFLRLTRSCRHLHRELSGTQADSVDDDRKDPP